MKEPISSLQPSPEVECHRAADLVRQITQVFALMGGTTLLGPSRENLCRRATAEEARKFDGRVWVIEAQGLPNLIHELVHALYLGRLDDDHGFDYGEIPLDVERPEHRVHLWEELACCGLSTTTCAVFQPESSRATWAQAWFAEQFEIQGVFHGLEHDLQAFRKHVDRQIRHPERQAELEETVDRGRRLVQAALRDIGADFVVPPCDLVALWRNYLDCTNAKPTGD